MKSKQDSSDALTERYLAEVERLLVSHFDIYRNESLGGTHLAFMALHKRRDEKYLLTRSARIWEVENRQLILVHAPNGPVSPESLSRFEDDVRSEIEQFVDSRPEHMSSVVVAATVIVHPVVEAVVRKAVNYRKLKFLKFGLHGWLEIYLAVVDLESRRVHVHPKGLSFADVFRQAFEREEPH